MANNVTQLASAAPVLDADHGAERSAVRVASATVTPQASASKPDGRHSRLSFFNKVLAFTQQIRTTTDADQAMLAVTQQLCDLFECEWFALQAVSDDHAFLVPRYNNGPATTKELTVPIAEHNVAGYVAAQRRLLCIRDVYNDAELTAIGPALRFERAPDLRAGQRTRQMLVAPLLDVSGSHLLGVLQLVNHRSGRPFRSIAGEALKELCATLAVVLRQRLKPAPAARSHYDFLITDGVLSTSDFKRASRAASAAGRDLERVLLDDYQVTLPALGAALARFYCLPYEPFKANRIKPSAVLKNIKREFVEHNGWLLIEHDADLMVILATDPEQVRHSRMVNNLFPKARLMFRVTTGLEFRRTVEQFFGGLADSGSVGDLLSGMTAQTDEARQADALAQASAALVDDNELVKLVNKIIVDAYRQGASDIHIEPGRGNDKTLIRFRKDGALEPYIEIPASYRNALLARIKIMCQLDTSEHRKPQDGKIRFHKEGQIDIELRVVTIPSSGGVEDVVMRILAAGAPTPLEQLDVLPHNLQRLKQAISNPHGLFFVCGPTGSGKTTTLHSVLRELNTLDTKIWTAEDPVEITQKGMRQVQINRKAGLDFATVMRSLLRADPDIIMIGEMRDKESVSICLEASLTGHLVFATLHTNSAAESIVRLLDMGMDPFNCADALLGVLAQRLARRLCVHCRKACVASTAEMDALVVEYCAQIRPLPPSVEHAEATQAQVRQRWSAQYADSAGQFTLNHPVGCSQCNNGYKGRIGLHELMIVTEPLKRLLQERARVSELLAAAMNDGMRTLKMDGIEKVLAGATDMQQVRAVCIQ